MEKKKNETINQNGNNVDHDMVTAMFNEIIANMDSYDESFLLALVNRVNKYHEEHNNNEEKPKVKKKN